MAKIASSDVISRFLNHKSGESRCELVSIGSLISYHGTELARFVGDAIYVQDFDHNMRINASVTTRKFCNEIWWQARRNKIPCYSYTPKPSREYYYGGFDETGTMYNKMMFPKMDDEWSTISRKEWKRESSAERNRLKNHPVNELGVVHWQEVYYDENYEVYHIKYHWKRKYKALQK